TWPASSSNEAMPSRSRALSSATTTRSPAGFGASLSVGVTSRGAMTEFGGGEGMIADRLDLQRVEHAVARILAEQELPLEAYGAVLQVIGTSLSWELGTVWEVDPEDGRLRCVRTWHDGRGEGIKEFEALSERL